MMCIQSRKRKLVSPFSSFLSNSFLLFSLHFPLDLNCQSNCKRKKITHSGDPTSGASTSSAPPRGRDYEGGEEQREGNNYEVFLSFRGKDNRKSFTDYLYTSLVDAGIHVFRDNNELRVGEEFGSELLRSITQSKISIPIISGGYASSKWCLRELAHMLKCKKYVGQIVLPIFYKVSPSQVRYLTGRFGDAINAHKKKLGEMTAKEWEEALKEVTSLNGWESEKTHDGYEGTLVKTVVRKVMSELKRLFLLNVPKELVGIDDRVDHIMGFIGAEFNDTRIIGIHGMGGIGKTTLAKVLYNKLSSHYEYRSFRADIRETCKSNGIVCVQKKLISDINGDSSDVSNVDDGISVLKYRFTNKKVLILLDDVDDDTHLNALVEDGSWFKAGSIVIITTRDKSILDKARVSHAYQLNGLLFNQSLVLFSRHAFRKDYPPSDYEVISRDVVSTCGGLPLALEVIGSFLCGKTKEAWIATSKKLEKVPHMKVKEKLMISYDALDPGDKQIFLDIACFLIGSSRQISTYMWDACDFYPGKGIEVLSLMSLITIDKGGKLKMHDQLRDLGREIVYLENEKKPEKRSRLWDYEEAKDVLVSNKGTSRIEALCLPEYDYWQGSYTADDFKKLNNLRFLRVNDVRLTGDFQNLLPRLMWLELKFFRRDFELINFHPKELIVLDLTYSKISEDWGGWSPLKMATKLKVLNLTGCNLRTTPDLSSFKSLEILILEYCRNLEEIHPSIEDIKALVSLNVKSCWKLKELPLGVGRMEELRELLVDATPIKEIPISRGCLTKLETLSIAQCKAIDQLPECLGSLESLTQLYLSGIGIEELPETIGSLKQLKILDASYCMSLARVPSSIGSLVSLQRLLLSECHSLREIPNSIGKLASLTELQLESTAIEELPEAIGSLKKLKTLNVSYCASLARVPSSIGHLASLSLLNLTGCDKLTSLPDSIGSLVSLQCLLLSKCHLREILDSIGKLSSLIELHLKSTPIMELPKSIENMQNLRITYVTELLDDSGILAKLQELRASGRKDPEGLPKNTGELFSPDDLDSDKLQKPSELLSRVLALERPRTPPAYNSAMDYQTANSEHVLKRSRSFGISDEDSESMADGKPRIADKSGDKSRIWKLTEINEPLQCRSIRLPHNLMATRVSRLIYANSGRAILAISSKGVHGLWNWPKNDQNLTGSATISVELRLWRLPRQNWMTNDTSDTNPEDAAPCFALSKHNVYLISALRGKIHLFNLHNCKTMTTFMPPPPAATFVAFYPQDNNIIAIGMEDSSILIYNVRVDAVKKKLKGHQERITGLAFSSVLNVLVSSGADSQLCVWRTDGWEKQASKVLHMPTGRAAAPLADTRVQFHLAQIHLLVVHERRIAIYEAPILECLTQWVTREASSPITHATYSCDGQSIYTSFEDGSIGVLAASTLRFRCRINAVAYIPPNPSLRVYPLVIAAHPSKPNQFALGLTDGSVFVLEPSESEGEWGTTPVENGAGPSTTSGATASDQPRR